MRGGTSSGAGPRPPDPLRGIYFCWRRKASPSCRRPAEQSRLGRQASIRWNLPFSRRARSSAAVSATAAARAAGSDAATGGTRAADAVGHHRPADPVHARIAVRHATRVEFVAGAAPADGTGQHFIEEIQHVVAGTPNRCPAPAWCRRSKTWRETAYALSMAHPFGGPPLPARRTICLLCEGRSIECQMDAPSAPLLTFSGPALVSQVDSTRSMKTSPTTPGSTPSGGCSGQTYSNAVDAERKTTDLSMYEDGPLRAATDPQSAADLDGRQIDNGDDLIRSGFRFRNAKAGGSCGCGADFSLPAPPSSRPTNDCAMHRPHNIDSSNRSLGRPLRGADPFAPPVFLPRI